MSPLHLKALWLSEKLYRTALLVYPAAYRARFGDEMLGVFHELNTETVRESGVVGGIGLWAREAAGMAHTAFRERFRSVRATMHSMWQPSFAWALAVFVTVLAGYVVTLAPTVTFWDAGEYLAASKVLGVPHPPGSPAWVFLSHAWATFFPFGEYAFRVNLMTAVFSAAAAAFLFMVIRTALARSDEETTDTWANLGAAAAALVAAFTFTVWQNSNETEVYAIAGFSIAATTWLAMVWREHRGTPKATRMLFLMTYIGAFSIGNHLLALLVGPAVVGFMWHVLRTDPLRDAHAARAEWAHWSVFAAVWVLLIGTGLGSTALLIFAGSVFLIASLLAAREGSLRFALAILAVSVVGVSTYLFLYIRAAHVPFLNMSDPSTWDALLSVIRREQYPPRLPIDNPLYLSGAGNPGRTFGILWLQILNYLQYFDWQWAMGLDARSSLFALSRLPFTLAFTSLGIYGALVLKRRDRSAFWLLVMIFVITGPALVGYMNFKPGASIGFGQYPSFEMHEVRERDYFFLVSFQVWGLFAGVGIAGLFRSLRDTLATRTRRMRWPTLLAAPVLATAVIPFVLNFNAATRRHGPEAQLARDFAYNMLQTIEPYGILITYGDNDTYPLWYAQAVEGLRPDVTVIVRTLANTDWFIRQLRDRPVEAFDPNQAPWFAEFAPEVPPPPLHTMSDADIAGLRPVVLPNDYLFRAGRVEHTYPAGTVLRVDDMLTLRLIQENVGRRPIYFSSTAGEDTWVRLGDSLVQEGLALRLYSDKQRDAASVVDSGVSVPVDLARTQWLATEVYRYGDLLETDTLQLDPTNRQIAFYYARVFLSLAQAHDTVGNREQSIENLVRAYHLAPTSQLRAIIEAVAPAGALRSTSLSVGGP